MEHGFPAAPHAVSISTSGLAPHEAYDYWRNLAFSDFEPDHTPRSEQRAFRAKADGLCWERADFFLTESGPVSGSRGKRHLDQDGLDSLSIGLVLKGERRSEQLGDNAMTIGAGGLFAYDAAHASRVEWSQHRAAYLVVRRSDASSTFGEIPPPAELMRRLAQSPMRHVLADQFLTLAKHMRFLTADERAYLLEQTIQLALFALANPAPSREGEDLHETLYLAALRYIELNLADRMLEASRIAASLNCSRSTLYRAFAAKGLGVAEAILDKRLQRARVLLQQSAPHTTIAEIALACGLYDTANFSRQFRRSFGLAPSDVRPQQR